LLRPTGPASSVSARTGRCHDDRHCHNQPAFNDAERLALAGFLVGYHGLIREAYALDLRQFATWRRARSRAVRLGRLAARGLLRW